MPTDIQRWGCCDFGLVKADKGAWVEYDDHVAVVAEANAEIERLKASSPAWHDKPTCEGVWIWDNEVTTVIIREGQPWVRALYTDEYFPCSNVGGKWYGPIPEEPK